MKVEGNFSLPAPQERLWQMLQNPEFLKEVMPGCKELKQTAPDHYEGLIDAKVGPIASQYKTRFSIHDQQPPSSYRVKIEGDGKGGFVRADVLVRLEPNEDQNETILTYSGEANIGGTVARIGQRLVDSATKMLINKGFKSLQKKVEETLNQ